MSILKTLLTRIGQILLCLAVVPLFLGLLFFMPTEFAVSSWHLLQATQKTTGVILESSVETSRGKRGTGRRSAISYEFDAGGARYISTRIYPGFLSERSSMTDGGELAKSFKAGDSVEVFYDPQQPSLALIRRGWPKMSIGFSLAAWGFLCTNRWSASRLRKRNSFLGYSVSRAMILTGFVVAFIFPAYIAPRILPLLAGIFVIFTFCVYCYAHGRLRSSE